ncbi:hypothetical protein F0562_023202 [Nyssa sinensis]|uniref:Protein MEI2-like 4 n=1 Tax=Nyssa sinensis TaxID=561372 RepID=A0A5J5BIF3_9ASTE|nr:hypothetical protein F0562_023202 [Nyssa sinensis]
MPFEIMDQRGISTSPHFFKEICFPSEIEVGIWKPKTMHDHIDGIIQTPGSKSVASSSLEKLFPIGARSADCMELPPSCVVGEQKEKIYIGGEEGTANLYLASGRYLNHNQKTWPNLYVPSLSYGVERNGTKINGTPNQSILFSSPLSEVFSRKLGLSLNNDLIHKSVTTAASSYNEVEPLGSTEEIEVQTIGNLLPDEDDLLFGVINELEDIAHGNDIDDVEDLDLFSSGGGMELEGDNCSLTGQINSGFTRGISNCHGSSSGPLASEHPYGEHPSRTLFVRNINSNVEDSELRTLFEQYGEIRTLYTACKHRGFVMIAYYDIRAARNAMIELQNKPLRRRKIDIHYSIPKENPSEKDINQGILVVFNLDSSVSNYELSQIFGSYGEIKEIRETPHNHHHKFIEFYDVRAAEAALHALNRCDIAGKQIKIEPSHLGGARQCSMQQCSELEHDESGPCRSPNDNLSSEYLVVSPGGMTRSCMNDISIQGLYSARKRPISTSTENALPCGSSSVPNFLPSPVRVASAGNHFGLCEPSHSLDQVNFDTAGNIGPRVADRRNDRRMYKMGSSGQPMNLNGVFGSSGNGTCPLNGHRFAWSNINSFQHHPSSSLILSNSPSFVNGLHVHCPPQLPGFSGAPPHMLNTVSPAHHKVGSAPTSFWDRQHAYSGGSPEASGFQLGSLGGVGFPRSSPLQPLERASHNSFAHFGENCMDMLIYDALRSPHQISHNFSGRNAVTSMPTSFGSPNERVRNLSRRGSGGSSSHADKKQFELEIDRILCGEDSRTTLMIKNIPNKYTSKMLLAVIDEHCRGTYDFIYLPIDFKNKCNVGYAFINMIDPLQIIPFHKAFNGKKWEKFNSEKVASLAYARIQGKASLIAHFQNSSLMNEDKRCRPILFRTEGPNAGDQEPFPTGANIRSRPIKSRGLGDEDNHHQGSPLTSVNGDPSLSVHRERNDCPKLFCLVLLMAKGRGKKFKNKGQTISRPDTNSTNKRIKKKKKKVPKVKATNAVIPAPAPLSDPAQASASAFATNGRRAASRGKEKGNDNLERLSGFIFMCNGKTKPECYHYRVFGLPAGRQEEVRKIKRGTKLFLFDIDLKLLYGIYEATSGGKLNLEPAAFGGKFPAQVRFQIYKDCLPLPEKSLKHAIQDNYQGSRFKPELSGKQVRNLLSLFRPFAASSATLGPPPMPNVAPSLAMPPSTLREQFQPSVRLLPPEDPYLAGMQHGHALPIMEPQPVQQRILTSQHEWYRTTANMDHVHPTMEQRLLPAPKDSYYFAETQGPYLAEDHALAVHDPYPRYMAVQEMVPHDRHIGLPVDSRPSAALFLKVIQPRVPTTLSIPSSSPEAIAACFLRSSCHYQHSNLHDRDVLSKSDPMAVIYTKGRDGSLQELGRTEVVLNSLNPSWITKHTIAYHFEVVQTLVFRVYDVDTQFHDLEIKVYLCVAVFSKIFPWKIELS